MSDKYVAALDPNHPGNGPDHHTGKICIEKDCEEPAGTAWGPYWCVKHNGERIMRIGDALRRAAGVEG